MRIMCLAVALVVFMSHRQKPSSADAGDIGLKSADSAERPQPAASRLWWHRYHRANSSHIRQKDDVTLHPSSSLAPVTASPLLKSSTSSAFASSFRQSAGDGVSNGRRILLFPWSLQEHTLQSKPLTVESAAMINLLSSHQRKGTQTKASKRRSNEDNSQNASDKINVGSTQRDRTYILNSDKEQNQTTDDRTVTDQTLVPTNTSTVQSSVVAPFTAASTVRVEKSHHGLSMEEDSSSRHGQPLLQHTKLMKLLRREVHLHKSVAPQKGQHHQLWRERREEAAKDPGFWDRLGTEEPNTSVKVFYLLLVTFPLGMLTGYLFVAAVFWIKHKRLLCCTESCEAVSSRICCCLNIEQPGMSRVNKLPRLSMVQVSKRHDTDMVDLKLLERREPMNRENFQMLQQQFMDDRAYFRLHKKDPAYFDEVDDPADYFKDNPAYTKKEYLSKRLKWWLANDRLRALKGHYSDSQGKPDESPPQSVIELNKRKGRRQSSDIISSVSEHREPTKISRSKKDLNQDDPRETSSRRKMSPADESVSLSDSDVSGTEKEDDEPWDDDE